MFKHIKNLIYLPNEPLNKHCSFKIGGNAKHFLIVNSIDALLDSIYLCKQHSIKSKIIGGGSNLLFDDSGFDGAIIKYNNSFIKINNNTVYSCSGLDMFSLIQHIKEYNLGGLEFSIGVPAMLGGAIVNNLGAYNNDISTYVKHITVLRKNHIIYLNKGDCNFEYHSSIFQKNNDIILAATFNLPYQNKSITQKNLLEYLSKRTSSQPLNLPNAGSIFKRSNNIIPAKLIDTAGLKGLQINNCQISTKHAGFIVNLGNASSADVLALIEIIKNKIYDQYDVILEPEIEYVPF